MNYKHKHLPGLTCSIIEETKKDFKVLQTEGNKKPVIKFYESIYFSPDKGIFIKNN